jgi:hypothetical protein
MHVTQPLIVIEVLSTILPHPHKIIKEELIVALGWLM